MRLSFGLNNLIKCSSFHAVFHSHLEVFKKGIIKFFPGRIQQNVHNMEYYEHWGLYFVACGDEHARLISPFV